MHEHHPTIVVQVYYRNRFIGQPPLPFGLYTISGAVGFEPTLKPVWLDQQFTSTWTITGPFRQGNVMEWGWLFLNGVLSRHAIAGSIVKFRKCILVNARYNPQRFVPYWFVNQSTLLMRTSSSTVRLSHPITARVTSTLQLIRCKYIAPSLWFIPIW